MKASSFKNIVKIKSVEIAEGSHYKQLQRYMGKLQKEGINCHRTLYTAYNKDTSEIYVERIKFDQGAYNDIERNVRAVILAEEPPERAFEPTWFECRFCNFHSTCHDGQPMDTNCRTCTNSSIIAEGNWICNINPSGPKVLTIAEQKAGCVMYKAISND